MATEENTRLGWAVSIKETDWSVMANEVDKAIGHAVELGRELVTTVQDPNHGRILLLFRPMDLSKLTR